MCIIFCGSIGCNYFDGPILKPILWWFYVPTHCLGVEGHFAGAATFRRWTMKSNPCCIIVNPRTPKFQCCLWAARLGPVDKKIKPWTPRKLDRVLCNIEISVGGFYLVDVCGVWFFVHLLFHCQFWPNMTDYHNGNVIWKYWWTMGFRDAVMFMYFQTNPMQSLVERY